jgi:dihydrofolate reductase
MRKVIVCNIMSLDGYYTGPGGNVMAMPMDSAFNAYNVERMRTASTILLGAVSYQGFRSFWPSVADNPAMDEDNRELSRLYKDIEKLVVSDTLKPDADEPWYDTTTIVSRAAAHDYIRDLKTQAGKDILIYGSHILWNDLLAAGLVDELHLTVGSVVLGGGTPIFEGAQQHSLEPIDARTLDGECKNTLIRFKALPPGGHGRS